MSKECQAIVIRSGLEKYHLPSGVKPGEGLSFLEVACANCPSFGKDYTATGETSKVAEQNTLSQIADDSALKCWDTGERIGARLASQGVVSNPDNRS